MTTDPARLVYDFRPLALKAARQAARSWPWLADDLESVALVAVWRAAKRWDPGIALFSTFAKFLVRSAIRNELARHSRRLKFSAAYRQSRDPDFDRLSNLAARQGPELDDQVEDLLAGLAPLDGSIVRRHAVDGETCEEIGRSVGLTRQRVHQRLVAALRVLHNDPLVRKVAANHGA